MLFFRSTADLIIAHESLSQLFSRSRPRYCVQLWRQTLEVPKLPDIIAQMFAFNLLKVRPTITTRQHAPSTVPTKSGKRLSILHGNIGSPLTNMCLYYICTAVFCLDRSQRSLPNLWRNICLHLSFPCTFPEPHVWPPSFVDPKTGHSSQFTQSLLSIALLPTLEDAVSTIILQQIVLGTQTSAWIMEKQPVKLHSHQTCKNMLQFLSACKRAFHIAFFHQK